MKLKIIATSLALVAFSSYSSNSFVTIISKKDSVYEVGELNPPAEPILRNMCSDILARGESVGNGVYSVDPDGVGTDYSAKEAYCDMTGGGWTLFDSFGTKLKATDASGTPSFNAQDITTKTATTSAGYSVRTDYPVIFNDSRYARTDYHLQWFSSNDPSYKVGGWIRKTMPDWITGLKVNHINMNPPSSNNNFVSYNGVEQTIPASTDTTTDVETIFSGITGGQLMQLKETDMFYIESVWVK